MELRAPTEMCWYEAVPLVLIERGVTSHLPWWRTGSGLRRSKRRDRLGLLRVSGALIPLLGKPSMHVGLARELGKTVCFGCCLCL